MVDKMPLTARAIVIEGHQASESGYDFLCNSNNKVNNAFTIEKFKAIVPENVEKELQRLKIRWNYPWQGAQQDLKTGLKKSAYPTTNPLARIACALSHYKLWKACYVIGKPILIMEHDAFFTQRLQPFYSILDDKRFDIIGLNAPLGNTRRAQIFLERRDHGDWDDQLKRQITDIDVVPVPTIDNFDVPQGLAGNSAYIIKPNGAKNLLLAVQENGLWPNDAIMCKQLIPRMGVTKGSFTDTQKIASTTT
tara:strand:- start:186 stop:935 length:750 start_codon:yes stop_codon:yes gene_type:complete